jgi:NAD(P)-dependent dehydrogenase (short-subunit alcohol dehydrogenase family)
MRFWDGSVDGRTVPRCMSSDSGALTGKVAVVTGASRGIGKQTCLALAELGASVVLASRTEEPRARTPGTLHETAEAIRATGGDALVVQTDLARQSDLDRLVSATLEQQGHVDIVVNNAAYTVGKALWAHVPELTRDQWEKGFAVNVTAPLMLIEGFWESMRAAGGGVVVNVTSGAANLQPLDATIRLPGSKLPDNGPLYGASKAALDRMANVVAAEGAPHNIAVINLEPGFVLTETMEQTFTETGVDGTDLGAISPTIPARAIAYLCSCPDPMQYSGQIVSAPALVASLPQ